jgi:hypothetical protein
LDLIGKQEFNDLKCIFNKEFGAETPTPFEALDESNKHGQIIFIDCSLFLIG